MKCVLTNTGTALAVGNTTFLAPQGGQVLDGLPDTALADFAAAQAQVTGLQEVWYDTANKVFAVRSRGATAQDTDRADVSDIRTKLQAALNNWATLTADQKDALLRVCVRGTLRSLRDAD